jgi:ribose/xylose/arabinose/galactoside ABC-type transport system permease subunit
MTSPNAHISWKRLASNRLFWPILGLALLLGFNLIFCKGFFHLEVRDGHLYGSLVDVLKQGSRCMLLALGMTLVIATGGVDLSVGSIMAIAGAIAALLVVETEIPFAAVVAVALGVAAVAGMLNGALVAYVGIQPIVATLILMVAGRGVAKLITDGQILVFGGHKTFCAIDGGHFLYLPVPIAIVAVVFAATVVLTRKTAAGMFIEAVGDNETASRFSGVNVSAVKIMVYAFSGLCAGIAGLIDASGIEGADSNQAGLFMELDAIFAVVVGGTALTGGRFTLAGSIIGAVLIQTLTTTMYYLGMPAAYAPAPKALVIIAVCLLQSEPFRRQLRSLPRRLFPRHAVAPEK